MVSVSRRNRMGYKKYQGRGSAGSFFLKVLVCILAVLVVGGAGFLLAKQDEFSLPSLPTFQDHTAQSTQDTQEDPAPATQEVSDSQTPEATPSPTVSPKPQMTEIRAVEVTVDQLLDGSAQRRVEQAGCSALVVEVKDRSGHLKWPSQVAKAQEWGAVSGQKSLTDALKSLSDQGIYLVARVDCLRDQLLAGLNVENSVLVTKSGRRWYDFWGMSWVSPMSQTVRDYLEQVCVELSQMGFDELVLSGAHYPDEGEVYALAQSSIYPGDRTTSVELLWKELSTALADSGVVLSAQVRGESVVDGGTVTGLTPELLKKYAQRVWVTTQDVEQSQVDAALTQAGIQAAGQMARQSANSGQTIWE